jgi:hypothetical protein
MCCITPHSVRILTHFQSTKDHVNVTSQLHNPYNGVLDYTVPLLTHTFICAAGFDGNVNLSKAVVLAGTARLMDLCADVPVECIICLLAGHCGADYVVAANDDVSWETRDQSYDVMTPAAAFDLARKERVRHRLDASVQITPNMLAVFLAGNGGVHKRMLDRVLVGSSQKRARVDEIMNGDSDAELAMDGEHAMQTVTHHTDSECCKDEASHDSDSDDSGV